ncbi:putative WW domain-containing protein [Dioscorea sansibarensis]
MTAPSIEMIAESLKNCSLGRNRGRARGPPVPPPQPEEEEEEEDSEDESEGLTVELNSDVALPRNWEQCLDMRTGEVYYLNWRTGMRTKEDPRNPASNLPSTTCYCSESSFSGSGDNASSSNEEEVEEEDEETRDTASSSGISSICSSSSCEVGGGGGGDITGQVLVAAGCKVCFMYFMVPKSVEACPKCSAALLHL